MLALALEDVALPCLESLGFGLDCSLGIVSQVLVFALVNSVKLLPTTDVIFLTCMF